ncbi:MAG: ATP-dependent phosphofructokinase / diphosphate-dependent phosphofructokinase [Oceanotoga sp.]|jgi:6-phosphofructokinase 1|uniref:Pyrophosphate--fructose 6-phosphate 1-phosphotransferase n=1 Tax=Oceanotoga teriensis TaxID=515440 RepID=A0AA45HIB3_9BACT|nr:MULTISPECIES: 6-phosphofructokinase [Oceanotoga]MDN5341489.1 ATP-dependent phosphofructokinase / diphosphate-dependent phosphofructokinase [Oceanotoga sp.]PWJ90054.1 6-phosphofructokinase 1 [Oceanotoga teriensis]
MVNAVYAQSGGVTSVINASALGVYRKIIDNKDTIENLFIGINGINGIAENNLIILNSQDIDKINLLEFTPSSAFGSCRKKLSLNDEGYLKKIFDTFKKNNIRYFFYNGGNDSMDTANLIYEYSKKIKFDLKVIGIPKTIDNDLCFTDHTPGYGSTAKYLAISALEGSIDVKSMCYDSTRIFILETMGRHAGWLTASTALARLNSDFGPHIILIPERAFNKERFLMKVKKTLSEYGYCSIAVSEGIKDEQNNFLSDLGYNDNFGNTQLGFVGKTLSTILMKELGEKSHVAIPDYLQRSGRHISSLCDVKEAIKAGEYAVEYALKGINGKMVTFKRISNKPYEITFDYIDLNMIANQTKFIPDEYITEDGMDVNEKFIEYAKPLIKGESYPEYKNGIPLYYKL